MPIAELAALATAATWAFTGLLAVGPSQRLGAVAFSRLRMSMVFVMLVAACLITGSWRSLASSQMAMLILSALLGICLGDSTLFACLRRLGPRRTGILFATNAPMSVILGYLFLGEHLEPQDILGCVLVTLGVILAIVFGKRKQLLHRWEQVHGSLATGVILGLSAAFFQASSSLIAKPVMLTGVDPIAASMVRVGFAAAMFWLVLALPGKHFSALNSADSKTLTLTAINGFLGMGIGMTLLLYALAHGEVGIIATLSSTSPVLILPLLWIKTRECPSWAAWFGAALSVAGIALISLH